LVGSNIVRYADDCKIFTKSKYSARRVKDSAIRFLEGKMKLKVNMEKTEARRAVAELNAFIRGWINYYARSNIARWIRDKSSWIRRKIWCYLWKQWKTADNRRKKLKELGRRTGGWKNTPGACRAIGIGEYPRLYALQSQL